MDAALVFAGLYNAARPQGMGFLQYDPMPMTVDGARQFVDKPVDYCKGRVMKLRVASDGSVDGTYLYDRDNGQGCADLVMRVLETTGDPNHEIIQRLHAGGMDTAAAMATEFLNTKTTIEHYENATVVTLGVGDGLKDALKTAIDSARR